MVYYKIITGTLEAVDRILPNLFAYYQFVTAVVRFAINGQAPAPLRLITAASGAEQSRLIEAVAGARQSRIVQAVSGAKQSRLVKAVQIIRCHCRCHTPFAPLPLNPLPLIPNP